MRAAEAAVAAARLDLQFTEVRSPIDGRAGRALVTDGNLAQADATLLTTLVSLDPMYVYFESDEQTYLRYNELAAQGRTRRRAQPGARRPGQRRQAIRTTAPSTSSTTRSMPKHRHDPRARRAAESRPRVHARACSPACSWRAAAEFKAMLVDDKAVLTDQDRKYVYVLGAEQHRRAQGHRARAR